MIMNKKATTKVFFLTALVIVVILSIIIFSISYFTTDKAGSNKDQALISGNLYNSLSDCSKITNIQERDYCYYNFFVLKEQVTSLEDCKKITSNSANSARRDSCYGKLAELREDKSICDNYESSYFKPLCLSAVACKTGDVSTCQMFEKYSGSTSSDTVLCYKCVAIKNNDGSLCSKIMDNGVRYH